MKYKSWRELSLREKIGQTVILNNLLVGELERYGNPNEQIKKYGGLKNFLEQYPVGGFFVGGEVIKEATENSNDIRKSILELSESSSIPLLFCSDMENGCGSMIKGLTPFPVLMALGATQSEKLAYDYGKGTALEARSIGVNCTFSPVADLNLNRFNPVTNVRGMGDDAELVSCMLNEIVKGMQDYGLAATAKHFPGDGTDYRDQHLVTTCNSLELEEWKKSHGAVFQALIDCGVNCIMTGHISLPAYQKETFDGRYLPATLSHELSTKLLKEEMGFNGAIVSDALVMGGYLKWYERSQADIECFKAGTDLLLWPTMEYFDRMEKAILSGEVPMDRLDDAVSRIWGLKEKMGLFEEDYCLLREMSDDERLFVQQTALTVADSSLTLLRDRDGLIPFDISKIKKVLVVAVTMNDPSLDNHILLARELEKQGIEVLLRKNITFEELQKVEGEYDLIIYALYSRPHQPMGPVNFSGPGAQNIWAALTSAREKSVVVSFGSPYFFNEYFEAANIYINAYSYVPASQRSLVKALFGEIPFCGQSPVEL